MTSLRRAQAGLSAIDVISTIRGDPSRRSYLPELWACVPNIHPFVSGGVHTQPSVLQP